MSSRVTRSRRTSTSPLALSRVLEGQRARRRAKSSEQQLTCALAGDFGPGVRSDVLAAQYRATTKDSSAA